MPALVFVVLVAIGWAVAVAVRQRAARAAINATRALAAPIVTPERLRQQEVARDAALALDLQDMSALRLESGARELLPLPGTVRTDKEPVKPITDLYSLLEQHSVVVAGMEQILLGAVNASAGSVEHLAQLMYGAMVPDHLLSGVGAVLRHAAAGAVTPALGDEAFRLVGDVTKDVAQDLGKDVGKALFDAQAFHTLVAHVAFHDITTGSAIANFISNQADTVHIGFEVAANMLHLPGITEAIQHSAIAELARAHGESYGQAAMEHFYHHVQAAPGIADAFHHLGYTAQDGLAAHIPVITVFLSGRREWQLLAQHKTTSEVAFKNFAIDVAGRGIGAWVGAAIGNAVWPVVGGYVGAALGGMAAALLGGEVKQEKLKKAIAHCEATYDSYKTQTQSAAQGAIARVQVKAERQRAGYLQQIGTVPRLNPAVSTRSRAAVLVTRAESIGVLAQAQRQVQRAQRLTQRHWYTRMAYPSLKAPADLSRTVAQATANLKAMQALVPALETAREQPVLAIGQLAALSAELPLDARTAPRHWRQWGQMMRVVSVDAATHRRAVSVWNRQAAGAYDQAVKTLVPTIETELKQFDDLQSRQANLVKEAVKDVETEKERLGIK